MMNHATVRALGGAALGAMLCWSAPAAAQGDPETRLRQTITDVMGFASAQSGGDVTMRTSRPVETRMDGGTAIATLPDLAAVGRSGNVLELGTLTVSQREVAPGRVRYELSLPERVRTVERGGNVPFTATSAGGTLAIVRDVASGLFVEVDFRIADLNVSPPTRGATATTLGMLQLGWAITGRADGLADAAARIALSNLRSIEPNAGAGATAGEASIAFGIQGFRMEDIERVRRVFNEAPAARPGERVQRATEALYAIITGGGVAATTAEIAIANGTYNDGGRVPVVTVGRAVLSQVMTAMNQPQSAWQVRYEQDGLALRPGVAPLPQYIPARVNVNLMLERIPTQTLQAIGAAGLTRRGGSPLASVGTLIAAMAQMGTTLRIAPIEAAAAAVGGALNGTITADARSPFQATASGDLVVRGLDVVQRELGAQSQGRGGDSPAAVVAVLSALGQQGTGPDGQPVRTYRIELTPEGQLVLNGADMTSLLGAAGRRPRQAPPPAPQPPAPSK